MAEMKRNTKKPKSFISAVQWRYSLIKELLFYFQICHNWKDVIKARLYHQPLERFEIRKHQVITFRGAPPFHILRDIWQHKVYTHFYPINLPSPSIVVDIGANIGVFSLYSDYVWPHAKVLAYEPAPDNLENLRENIRLSGLESKISVQPFAVSDQDNSSMVFYIKKEGGWNSIFGDSRDVPITVSTISMAKVLMDVNNQIIDFMKIDCEGAEYCILSGKMDMFRNFVKYIAMEYHQVAGHSYVELIELFQKAGFEVVTIPPNQWNTGMLYGINVSLANKSK